MARRRLLLLPPQLAHTFDGDGGGESERPPMPANDSSHEPVPGEKLLFFLGALALFVYVYRVAKRTFAGRRSVARAVKAATEGEDD